MVLQDFRGNGGVRIAINQDVFSYCSVVTAVEVQSFFVDNFTFRRFEVMTYRVTVCGVPSYYKGSTLSLQDDLVQNLSVSYPVSVCARSHPCVSCFKK